MMKFMLFIALIGGSFSLFGQQELTWKDLEDVKITKDFDPDYNMSFEYPTFGVNIEKFDGKEVFIQGFLVPIDMEDGKFALSASPYKSCYFCGKAGQWTVIQLNLSSKRRYLGYRTDHVLTFKGTFRLNHTDVVDLIYVLEDAELYYGK